MWKDASAIREAVEEKERGVIEDRRSGDLEDEWT